ncbi:WD40 repeat domain-containing protein [Streptomyces sp. NPDC059008]|uniref:WD40 repeat domain-containing protein n=1 Tax=Streptomyces sp. NPDC059008 TaxID=3346693 RepID=UPI003690D8D1
MTDDRMMRRFSGHSHAGAHETTPVIQLDGALVTVSVDDDGTLWTCDLVGGACAKRDLELDAAGPEDDWYYENGVWDEDDPDEDERPKFEADDIVSALTVAHLDGRPVVVTGGGRFDLSIPEHWDLIGGAVRVWDLRTGRKIGKTLTGHGLGVCSLTTVASDQGLIAVSSCENGKLLAWNLTREGERVAEIEGSYNGGMGAGLVDGRPVAVIGGHDDFLQAWDLFCGEQIGKSLAGIKNLARAIAITEVNGRTVVVAGGDDEAVNRWDLTTQEPIGSPMTGHTDTIATLGTAHVAGRTIAVTGSNDGTTRVWDLASGRQIGAPFTGHHLQMVTKIAGTPVAVTQSSDDIRVWDLTLATR